MTFTTEYKELNILGYYPTVYIDYRCKWSTPFDMILNQIVEECRENKKHGSCGMGIWETEYRYAVKPMIFNLYSFNELSTISKINILKSLRDSYYIDRLKEYNISSVPFSWQSIYYSDNLLYNFIDDVRYTCTHSRMVDNTILKHFDSVIFENGQGLLLDQSLDYFYGDNLTPSNTGCFDASTIISNTFTNNFNTELCYVSRSYMTRHGAGKFVTECDKNNINPLINDTNNVTNPFQDNLRFGELNFDSLKSRILFDSNKIKNSKISIAFTHLNEAEVDFDRFSDFNVYKSNSKTEVC